MAEVREVQRMRRIGNLWEKIVSFENLLAASRSARKGKRFKPNVLRFEYALEQEVLQLQNAIASRNGWIGMKGVRVGMGGH